MSPAMESCNGGLMPRCLWTVGSLSWGGAVVALASGAISRTIAPRPARSCPARYGVAIASPRAKALAVRFRAIWGLGLPPLCFKPVNKSALRCAFDAFTVPFARLARPCLGERSKIVHLTTRAGVSEASATRPKVGGIVTKLSIAPKGSSDAGYAVELEAFARRISTTPPGACPIAAQLSMLETGAAQTCGKCVPCRDGLPQLASLVRCILDCKATTADLDRARVLAEMIRDASDCAIGYEAAAQFLAGLEAHADEYASHIENHACTEGTEQKVPCEALCPAHVNVPAYIALVAAGDYAGAVNMVRKDNPLPTACALVCEHPCERRCRRGLLDAPINIRGIKKFAVDSCAADKAPVPERSAQTNRRVAVIGGGPSGLTCAYFLSLMGHDVVIFEARKHLGGMLRYGIPAYRLPRERLDEDINAILAVGGIEVRLETKVDTQAMAELQNEFDAVYVAIGAQKGKGLRIDGAKAEGVISAVDLLGRIGDGDYPDFSGKRVAVIGGGNVAMDCVRTAVRAGADEVSCVYRRRVADMTALDAEIESAIAEGVEMITLESPDSIETNEAGQVVALITQPQMISAVKGGRPSVKAADKPKRRIEADVILVAVGQGIESQPFEDAGMLAEWGEFKANEFLEAQGENGTLAGVFVGGDCQTGPATAIKAIGAGKVAARNIDEYLGYHHTLDCGVDVPAPAPNDRAPKGRVEISERPARERKHDFAYVEMPMSREEAVQECGRCLRCDHFGCGALEGGRIQYA